MFKYNKKMVLNHLSYNWFIYFLTAIIISAFWYQAFNLYHSLKQHEKVTIYIASTDVKADTLEDILEVRLLDDKLKDIIVLTDNYEDQDFYLKLNTRGLVKTDLVILPKSVIDNLNAVYLFLPLRSEILANYIQVNDYEYLEISSVKIAIELKNALNEFISYNNEDYYILINKNSVNAGSLSQCRTDLALHVLNEFIRWSDD